MAQSRVSDQILSGKLWDQTKIQMRVQIQNQIYNQVLNENRLRRWGMGIRNQKI